MSLSEAKRVTKGISLLLSVKFSEKGIILPGNKTRRLSRVFVWDYFCLRETHGSSGVVRPHASNIHANYYLEPLNFRYLPGASYGRGSKIILEYDLCQFRCKHQLETEALKCFVQSAQVSRIERETRSNQSILTVLRWSRCFSHI